MTVRVFRRKDKKPPKKFDGPVKKWCRPKLLYSVDGKALLTTSKWYPNQGVAIFDWLKRGFVCIEDSKLGGGFEYRDFPLPDLPKLVQKYHDKFSGSSDG